MATCFVIQPFDGGKFDKRYEDIFEPAIAAAGLTPYRVDRDPAVQVTIEAIEQNIRDAAICLADITLDNPNVWYELGFAFAADRQVVLVCSTERTGRFPFDIQHRAIIRYSPESLRDFEALRDEISRRLKAVLSSAALVRQVAESQQLAPQQGLDQLELTVLAALAGRASLPNSTTSTISLREEVERAGLTRVGFALGFRRLLTAGFLRESEDMDERGELYDVAGLTDKAWSWIEENQNLFTLKKSTKSRPTDVPF